MKNFKIAFNDNDKNEVYSVTKKFNNIVEAAKYAKLIIATTSDECTSFTLYTKLNIPHS